jgi:hypothetical protein
MLQLPALAQAQPQPPAPTQTVTDESSVEEPIAPDSSGDDQPIEPDSITSEQNPLNPVGDSLDALIQMRINDDLWTTMQGELPCVEASEACIRQLQEQAIANSPALKAIDQRVELVNQKIDEARANNQRTINLGIFEPALTAFLGIETTPAVVNADRTVTPARQRGFIDRALDYITNPVLGVNNLLAAIGIPLFRSLTGGDAATQQREIAIADLQVKVAEIENQRGQIANATREQVTLQVLAFDQVRREFQIAQEVARRSVLRLRVIELDYRFGSGTMTTPQYLSEVSALDQQKAVTFRAWAQLRAQLVRVKILVLGSES